MDDDLHKEIRVRRVSGLAMLGLGSPLLVLGVVIAVVAGGESQGLRGLVLGGILTALGTVQLIRWRLGLRSVD